MMRALMLALCGVLMGLTLAKGAPLEGVLRLRGGKVNPWVGRTTRDRRLARKNNTKTEPTTHQITERRWASLLPNLPKARDPPREHKFHRKNTIAKKLSALAVTRESPGQWPTEVDNHEPLAEPGRNGVKVSVKLVADVRESKLHYTEFMWLMSEDLKEVVGMTQKKPQENATHWFVKNVGGKRVVPFAMCNRHGIWRGPAIDAPAANLTGVKPERMHSAKKKLKRQVDKLTLKIEKIESLKRGGKQFDRKKLHENRKSLRAAKKVVQEEKAKAHSEKDRRRQKSNLEELRKRLDFANKAVPGLTKEHYARLGGKRSKMLKKPKCIPEPPAQKAKDAAVDRLPDAKEGGVKDEKGGHEQAMEE